MNLVREDHAQTWSDTQALLHSEYPSITFDLLWAIFRPGSLLYAHDEYTDQGRILKAQTYEICVDPLTNQVYALIRSHMVAHDGRIFGTAVDAHRIYKFDGTRRLQDLAIYPLEYHPKVEEIKAYALVRGRRFLQLLEPSYVEASGSGVYEVLDPEWNVELRRFNVSISCLAGVRHAFECLPV